MINFKDPKDQTPSALAVVGLLLIVGSVVALFLHHRPNTNTLNQKYRKDQIAMEQRRETANKNLKDYEEKVADYQWSDKEDLVTPATLSLISQTAEANKLKMISFRPQKSVEGEAAIQLPVQFTVDGSFANVANMLDSLQSKTTKLAIQQVQFASQEGETDQVSANVTLYAFLKKPVKKTTTTTKTPPAAVQSGAKSNG